MATQRAAFAGAQKVAKVTGDHLTVEIRKALSGAWDKDTRERLRTILHSVSEDRAQEAIQQLKGYLGADDYAGALTQANERSVAWAQAREDSLITEVDATTTDIVNELTAAAIQDGLTTDEYADLLRDAFGFSDARADMIARTETAFAETAGTIEGYAASGVVEGFEWSCDPAACDECLELDGTVRELGEEGPPLHPNCLCAIAPVLSVDIVEG